MVAEESGMKIPASGATIEAENPLPTSSPTQIAIAFDSAGNAQTVTEAPDSHDGRRPKRQQPRRDVRRTAEYLAERGRLPAEALHLITRRTLAEAVSYIRKSVPGCSHTWAAEYYMRSVELLLPYCHLKLADLDTAGGLDGVHSLVAAHFLAASQFGARMTAEPANGRGAPALPRRALFDASNGALQADDREAPAMPLATSGAVISLPPRGRD
jgi:hypothetical protein